MKTNKIPCAVIKDLLPSYADDLTSPETSGLVREHLEECPDCEAVYEAMHGEIPPETEGDCGIAADSSEIDYLKKSEIQGGKRLSQPFLPFFCLQAVRYLQRYIYTEARLTIFI